MNNLSKEEQEIIQRHRQSREDERNRYTYLINATWVHWTMCVRTGTKYPVSRVTSTIMRLYRLPTTVPDLRDLEEQVSNTIPADYKPYDVRITNIQRMD